MLEVLKGNQSARKTKEEEVILETTHNTTLTKMAGVVAKKLTINFVDKFFGMC